MLLRVVGSALSARFYGPYEVLRKCSYTDYVVRTPDRKRKSCVCHVNMLKAYHIRESSRMEVSVADNVAVPVPVPVATACSDAACDADAEDDGVVSRHTYQQCTRFKNSEVLSDHLIYHIYLKSKHVILCNWLMTFFSLFNDAPSRITLLQHDINVGDAAPIKQYAYRVNVAKRAVMWGWLFA